MFPEESCPFCVRTPYQSNISCSCRKLGTGCSSLGLLNYWSLRWRGLQVNGQTGTVGAGRVGAQRTPASTVGVGRELLEPLSTAALCALRPGRTVTGHSPASPATSGIRPAEGQGQGEEGEGWACRGLPLLPAARPQRGRAQSRRCARLGAHSSARLVRTRTLPARGAASLICSPAGASPNGPSPSHCHCWEPGTWQYGCYFP